MTNKLMTLWQDELLRLAVMHDFLSGISPHERLEIINSGDLDDIVEGHFLSNYSMLTSQYLANRLCLNDFLSIEGFPLHSFFLLDSKESYRTPQISFPSLFNCDPSIFSNETAQLVLNTPINSAFVDDHWGLHFELENVKASDLHFFTSLNAIKHFNFLNCRSGDTATFLKDLVDRCTYPIVDFGIDPNYQINRDNDFWYDGNVAVIQSNTHSFFIDAVGDQRYELFVKDWDAFFSFFEHQLDKVLLDEYYNSYSNGNPIISFVNKGGGKTFLDVFGHLFKTDEEIGHFFDSGRQSFFEFEINNNNWLEILVSRNGIRLHPMSINDPFTGFDVGSLVSEEIEFVLDHMDEIVEYYEANFPERAETERG